MERLGSPEAKGIFAFFSRTPPKSAEDEEKERKEGDLVGKLWASYAYMQKRMASQGGHAGVFAEGSYRPLANCPK